MKILLGKPVAQRIESELARKAQASIDRGVTPTLAIALVGNNQASALYVRNKIRTAERIGIAVHLKRLPETASKEEIAQVIQLWNADDRIHGIIIQLPLPEDLYQSDLPSVISPEKDVDGLHPYSLFIPPTPVAVRTLLREYAIQTAGANVVIISRSTLVGMPLSRLLLSYGEEGDATVTVCHRKTKDLSSHTKQADIIISAAEHPGLITEKMISKGVVIVDVGMKKVNGAWKGDVDEERVKNLASALSPVPGGVGPLTVACLLSNVVQAAEIAKVPPKT